MDPVTVIGLAASIVQLITTTTQTVQYVNQIKNAPKEVGEFGQEASNVLILLWRLRARVDEAKGQQDSWFTSVAALGVPNGVLYQLQEALERVVDRLNQTKKLRKRIFWPLDKKELSSVLLRIERLKTSVSLALQDDLTKLARTIESYTAEIPERLKSITRVKSILEEQEVRAIDEQHRQAIEWLSPLNFFAMQNETLQKRESGTATWLLRDPKFERWMESSGDILCCQGIPGAGKTVLASVIVDHLNRRCSGSDDFAVGCVYFRYSERLSQSPANLIAGLWRQLVDSHEPMSTQLKGLYAKHFSQGTRPALDALCGLLQAELRSRSKIFIVLDALDECPDDEGNRSTLLDAIRGLDPIPNILITSRTFDDDLLALEHVRTLEIGARPEDMQKYITARIQRESRLKKHVAQDHNLAEFIVETLVARAKEMFLMATLHMNSLVTKPNPTAVRKALKSLPEGLTETYRSVLDRIDAQNSDDQEIANMVLLWLCYTKRPLTVKEIQEALSVDSDASDLDPYSMTNQDILISVCAGLVTVDPESQIVRFVHSTAEEHFAAIRRSRFPDAEHTISITCIQYLSFDGFSGPPRKRQGLNDLIQRFHFLEYAATFWGEHLRGPLEVTLCDKALGLLQNEPNICFAAQVLLLYTCGHIVDEDAPNLSGEKKLAQVQPKALALNVAAYFGLDHVVKMLQDRSTKLSDQKTTLDYVESNDRVYGTVLHWAALGGHESILRLLLTQEGTDRLINERNIYENTAVFEAVRTRRRQSIRQLMAHGADLFMNGDMNTVPPLHQAACHGTVEDIEVLMESNEKQRLLKHRAHGNTTALHGAVSFNRPDTTGALIDHGASLYEKEKYGKTPLFMAADYGATRTAALLIARDSSMQHLLLPDVSRRTPFQKACALGHIEVVKLFMQREEARAALLEWESRSYGALQFAALNGQASVVEFLLGYCPLPLPEDMHGTTLLHLAVRSGDVNTTVVILEHCKMDELLESRATSGCTALHDAAKRGHAEVVQVLADVGADLNAQCDNGRTALHCAAEENLDTVIEVLKEAGTDLEKEDDDDRAPLQIAIECRSTHAASALVLANAVRPDLSDSDMAWAKLQPWWHCFLDNTNETTGSHQPKTAHDVFHAFFCLKNTPLRLIPDHDRRIQLVQEILEIAEYWIMSKSAYEASVPLRPFTEHDGDFILLRSPPIVGRDFRPVQKITFTFTSRDQGFSDSGGKGTYDGSFTWFDAARQREGSLIRPFTIVKNIHAGQAFKTHTITWTSDGRLDNYPHGADTAFVAEWVKSLRPGDRVIVTPRALFPAWTNYVSRAEIEVYTSCLPDSRSRTSVRPDGELLATSLGAPFRKRYWWSYYAVRGCLSAGFDHDEDLLLWT